MILTRSESASDRLLKAQDTIKIMALLIILMTVTLGLMVHLICRDMELIKAQDEVVTSLEDRVQDLNAEKAELKERVQALEAQAVKTVSRGSNMQRLTVAQMRELAGTVHMEAQGECSLGKMLVAKVALNRLRWNPDKSLHEILHNPNAFATGTEYTRADMDAVRAAMLDSTYDHLSGFHNPKTATNPEAKERKILLEVGNHVFW